VQRLKKSSPEPKNNGLLLRWLQVVVVVVLMLLMAVVLLLVSLANNPLLMRMGLPVVQRREGKGRSCVSSCCVSWRGRIRPLLPVLQVVMVHRFGLIIGAAV
jgi:hypothetical protein